MNVAQTTDMTPETLFSPANLWQSWLDVEVALAHAQADLGIIPDWAAEGIAAVANVETLGLEALEAEAARSHAPINALTRVVAARAGPAGAYVHWGATTQNVMQTGRLLLMRRAQGALRAHLAGAVDCLAGLADSHAATPMMGRTNRRHALPISFGFKVAGWIEELDRAADRIVGMEKRVFVLPFGGAVGAMHAFEGRGRAISRRMEQDLNLGALLVPGRAVNDLFADYVVQLALLATTFERIATELYALMSEEIGEIAEVQGAGTVGSSTMPHKVNPKLVVHVMAMAADLRAAAAPAMQGALTLHEGDAAANHLVVRVLDRVCPLAWTLARAFETLCKTVRPLPDRMLVNLSDSPAYAASERLMMLLAPILGHIQAHDILQQMLADAPPSRDALAARVVALPALRGAISADAVTEALDTRTYLGESERIALEAAIFGRDLAARLRAGVSGAQEPQEGRTGNEAVAEIGAESGIGAGAG
ncbi:lyase family protein [Roseicitreum antarcticum]|uniref:3-carboxy-cis,cis-muconate cycloisomerase n=1 Tax=Roseicitreum antarcticum TaxID=564137 RepID=A0A1H2TQL4_9RHOB|nr:lyase family protein [Roseicitreum antarcticum]SDW45569.1 3-carboxy-cis,cis-muconate cycloisomerase [Roseicitreum antarcticum]